MWNSFPSQFAAVTLLLCSLLSVSTAAAESPPPAPENAQLDAAAKAEARFTKNIEAQRTTLIKKNVERGNKLLEKGPYDQAAHAAAVAYAFDPQPSLLFTMARAYHKAEQERAALLLYERFKQEEPSNPLYSQAVDYAAGLRSRLGDTSDLEEQLVKEQIELGKRYYQGGQYREAAEAYASAYALQRTPRLLFNFGQAYRRAGQLEAAYVAYQRFLAEDKETPMRRETEGYLADLRAQINNRPRSKRAWLWPVLAGALGIGLGLAIGLGTSRTSDPPTDGGFASVRF